MKYWSEVVEILWLFLNTQSPPFRSKTRLLYHLPESPGLLPEWLLFPLYEEINCKCFAKKILKMICIQPVKRKMHLFRFSSLHIRSFKIFLNFWRIWNGMVKVYFIISWPFFANISNLKLNFATKISFFENLQFLVQILKVELKMSFPMMYHL